MIWLYKEKVEKEWKPYFAWKPTPIGRYPLSSGQQIVWLMWIERKWLDSRECSSSYEYRLKLEKKC